MSDKPAADGRARGIDSKKGPESYISPLEQIALSPQCRALLTLFPLNTPRAQLAAFFGNRVTASAVRKWRSGKHAMPAWAIERLHAHAAQLTACIQHVRAGDMAKIGTENLRRYRANRNAAR